MSGAAAAPRLPGLVWRLGWGDGNAPAGRPASACALAITALQRCRCVPFYSPYTQLAASYACHAAEPSPAGTVPRPHQSTSPNPPAFSIPSTLPRRKLRFLANVDPVDVAKALNGLNPETTLVIVISKTFTTTETMLNARTVR